MSKLAQFYLGFSYVPGIGPTRFDTLLRTFGTVDKAYFAPETAIIHAIGPHFGQTFLSLRSALDPVQEIERLYKQGIMVIDREDDRYPQNLKEISDPPICLYVKGDISRYDWESDFLFAVVGTRNPTEYGKMITTKFSRELAENNAVIVSGMAMGVDALAHWAAIHAGKRTIAFLGCGVNIVYPAVNSFLYKEILRTGGLIISEFPPDKRTIKGHFIARNRLISGISKGVLVPEGVIDSGSLITARYALSQGKDVFAPPSPINSAFSKAPNLLLKEGAKLVTEVDDILMEFQMKNVSVQKLPVLTDIEREQCYTCTPIILDYSKFCKNCNTDNLYKVSYSSKLPTKCLHCGFDTAEEKYIPMGIYEKRPTLKGEGRELLNRIKKRNYGSTMPDY